MKIKSDLTGKPYFKCVDCHHRKSKRCNFTRTSEMQLREWCEYIRAMKAINGLTNEYIAEKAGVSIKTIERIMALSCDQDIMRETARRIEIATLGTASHMPCYLIAEEEQQPTEQRLQDALKALEYANATISDLKKSVEYLRNENDLKNDILRRWMHNKHTV